MPNSDETQTPKSIPEDSSNLMLGLLGVWILNIIHFAICIKQAVTGSELYMRYYVPIELVYGVGLLILVRSIGRFATAKEMIIAISVTTLISGACAVALYA
jgi:hypothetical protein